MLKLSKFVWASVVLVLALLLVTIIAPLEINVQGVKAAADHSPQLSNGFVVPSNGDTLTNFYYYITYYDSEGGSPDVRQVYIDGVAHEMSLLSGSTSDGVYRYGPKNLTIGNHNYYFYFDNGRGGTARLPEADNALGPMVSAGPPVIWDFPYGTEAFFCPAPANDRPYLNAIVNLPTGTEPLELLGVYWLDEVARQWKYFIPSFDYNTLTFLEPGRAYLVAVSEVCSWNLS
jgi:hypothetical protein